VTGDKQPAMGRLVLDYLGCSVSIEGHDQATLDWLVEFLCPSFQQLVPSRSRQQPTDWRVVIEQGDGDQGARDQGDGVSQPCHLLQNTPAESRVDCFTLDGHFESFRQVTAAQGQRLLQHPDHHTLLEVDTARSVARLRATDSDENLRLTTMRVIRELGTIEALNQACLPVHGGAIAVNGQGIMFTGPRRAGKTTTLLRSLVQHQADFIANDRLFLDLRSVAAVVRGMPTILKIRASTLFLLPRLHDSYRQTPWFRSETLAEARQRFLDPDHPRNNLLSLSASLNTAQLLAITGTRAVQDSALSAIVFPAVAEPGQAARLKMIGAAAAAERLMSSCLLRPSVPLQTAPAFRRASDVAVVPDEQLRELCMQVTARVPCFDYRLGREDLLPQMLGDSPLRKAA
jgi:hypothetical protein